MNEVDPATMSLEEIYEQPKHYFELYTTQHMPHLGIQYDRYYGHVLRNNGTKFFTIKDDDDWGTLEGGHSTYCGICTIDPSEGQFYSKLGVYLETRTHRIREVPPVIDGMSYKEYRQFLCEVEEALYDPLDFLTMKDDIYESEEDGLQIVYYRGRRRKSYSQPMFDIKHDHKSASGDRCYRCDNRPWFMNDDEVNSANYIPTFDENGFKITKRVHFIPFYAARRPHP